MNAEHEPKARTQKFLFVALPSDYGNILFPVGSYDQARELISDAGGSLHAAEVFLN